MLIDSHCHVLSSEYDNVDEIIKDSINSGVEKIIVNGYDLKTSKEAVELANKYDHVYAAVGIGPSNVTDVNDETYDIISKLAKESKVVAIGEVGLDYYWTTENKEKQLKVFKTMLKIAKTNNLPVIVHCRKSFLDTYNLLKESDLTGIIHCYSGSVDMAKRFIKLGFLLGIGGVITFKNAKSLKDVVKAIDINNFSLETDSPYLAPEPYRGKPNTPKNIKLVATEIANIKQVNLDEVIRVTGRSVCSKFDL